MAKKQTIIATTKIRPTTFTPTIRQLMGRVSKTRFDLSIQRNEVWDQIRKSLLMHSIMYGFPMPPVFARKLEPSEGEDPKLVADTDWMLDGKQRLSTIIDYCQDGDTLKDEQGKPIPALDEEGKVKKVDGKIVYKTYEGFKLLSVPTVTVVDETNSEEITVEVNGKRFTELPDYLQDIIMNAKIDMVRLENMTDEEQDEMFVRLNNGMPLKNMELTRAIAGTVNMGFIEGIAKTHFFSEVVDIPQSGKNRFADDELVTQILQLVTELSAESPNISGFSGKELKAFAIKLKADGLDEDMQTAIEQTTAYLGDALPIKQRDFRKVHIPTMFILANRAMQEGVSPRKFGGYVQQFFAERYKPATAYGLAASRGSAKKENVNKRLTEMLADYEAAFKNKDTVAAIPAYKPLEKTWDTMSKEQKDAYTAQEKLLIAEEKKLAKQTKKVEEPKVDDPKVEPKAEEAPKGDEEQPNVEAGGEAPKVEVPGDTDKEPAVAGAGATQG